MKHLICAGLVAIALPSPANAAPTTAQASVERTDFSGGYGDRTVAEMNVSHRFNRTTVVFDLARGTRDYEDEKYTTTRVGGTIYHDWSDRFYTETSAAIAGNSPVFAKHRLKQDLNLKFGSAVATVGIGHNRYFGNRDAVTWSAGGTYYFPGGLATYRYTGFDVEDLGNTHAHLGTVRVNDRGGRGFTQAWLGGGTALHDFDFRPDVGKGKSIGVALRRVQPLAGNVALDISVGRTWFDTDLDKYRGTTARIGFTILR